MKCKNCGEELRAEVAITEKGWIIFHECIFRGDSEKEVIANFEKLQNTSSNSDYAKLVYAVYSGVYDDLTCKQIRELFPDLNFA